MVWVTWEMSGTGKVQGEMSDTQAECMYSLWL